MARTKRINKAAVETVREAVGRGTSETTYEVATAQPASVVERKADPETLRAYSDVQQSQIHKVTSGAFVYLITAIAVYGILLVMHIVGWIALGDSGAVIITIIGVVILCGLAWIAWDAAAAPGVNISDVVVAASLLGVGLLFYSLLVGDVIRGALAVLAGLLAVLNPWSSSRLYSGLKTLNAGTAALDEVLYNNYTKVKVQREDRVVPNVGKPLVGERLMMSHKDDNTLLFGNSPYMLYRQIEDFVAQTMDERRTDSGKLTSGLTRTAVVGNIYIGPPNGTVPSYDVSYLRVTRPMYETIIKALQEIGLVQIVPAGTVWSKIAPGTAYKCGYTLGELHDALMPYTFIQE